MTKPYDPRKYVPMRGSAGDKIVRHFIANPTAEVASPQVAAIAGITTANVYGAIHKSVEAGLLTIRSDRGINYYRAGPYIDRMPPAEQGDDTAPRTDAVESAGLDMIARLAVIKLKGQMLSSGTLAEACSTTQENIDRALAPLVSAGKLLRIDVLRDGQATFDYRWSAAYVPSPEDWLSVRDSATTPTPHISPVAPPKVVTQPKAPAPAPKPASSPDAAPKPAPKPAAKPTPAPEPVDALQAGAELGRRTRPLGFVINAPASPLLHELLHTNVVPSATEANDMLCAINSRGELAIDLDGTGDVITFPPAQALSLKRFLDNTSILEELAGQGLI